MQNNPWDSYWEAEHFDIDILAIGAQYFCEAYRRMIGLNSQEIILDFGAGAGDVSIALAPKVKKCYVYDKSKRMQQILHMRTKAIANITVIDSLTELTPSPSVIILNTVIQYLFPPELTAVIKQLRDIGQPHTMLLITDIIPAHYSKITDLLEQTFFSIRSGFFLKFAHHVASRILKAPSQEMGCRTLERYDPSTLIEILTHAGFSAVVLKENLLYSKQRYSIRADYHHS